MSQRATYTHQGTARSVFQTWWGRMKPGFFVRRHDRRGFVTGFLTPRNGFCNKGLPEQVRMFETAQEAADAAHKLGVRFFEIMHNAESLKQWRRWNKIP